MSESEDDSPSKYNNKNFINFSETWHLKDKNEILRHLLTCDSEEVVLQKKEDILGGLSDKVLDK